MKSKPKKHILDGLGKAARPLNFSPEQLENFVAAGYVPQRKQLEFHAAARLCDRPDGPSQIGFGGARGPGKSHASFAQLALDDCRRIPGLKALYLRLSAKQGREQSDDLRRVVLKRVPHHYIRAESLVTFPNESRIVIGKKVMLRQSRKSFNPANPDTDSYCPRV